MEDSNLRLEKTRNGLAIRCSTTMLNAPFALAQEGDHIAVRGVLVLRLAVTPSSNVSFLEPLLLLTEVLRYAQISRERPDTLNS